MELSDPHRSTNAPDAVPPPALITERPPGPITQKQRQFFELMKPTQRPHPEVSGVIVVERTAPAWFVAGGVGAVALVAIVVLGMELSSAKAALAQRDIEIKALSAAATSAAATVADEAKSAALDQQKADAALQAEAKRIADAKIAEALKGVDATAIVDAVTARFASEIKKGDLRVAAERGPAGDARVRLTFASAALFDGKQSGLARRGEAVVARLGDTLAPLEGRVDVVVHTDRTAGRGESELGKSATRAVSFVRALTERSKLDPKRVTAAARGNVEHARKVDVIVSR